jgi:plasmid stabilization system protein ParE
MTELFIHPVAQLEYERATEWYAEKSPEAARRFAVEVEAASKRFVSIPKAMDSSMTNTACISSTGFRTTSDIDAGRGW